MCNVLVLLMIENRKVLIILFKIIEGEAMRNAITLDALRAIEAISQQGSFAAAAKSLFKVPSALTYTIGKLENDLGVTLFDRSKQRAILTPAGKLVLAQGRELLVATSALEDAVHQLETGWETHLVITHDTLVPLNPILDLVADFSRLNKMTELLINEEVLSGSWESLLSNKAQIVVGASGELPKGHFNITEIAQVDFCFALSKGHPLLAKRGAVTSVEIKQYPSIVVADSSTAKTTRSTGLLDSSQTIRVTSMAAKIQAQVQGVGIGFLPKHMIKEELAAGKLVVKDCEVPRHPEYIYMAWHKDANTKALTWFTQQLKQLNWSGVFSAD